MELNLHQVPFSIFGSHLALHYVPESWNQPGLLLRNVRAIGGIRESFRIQLERDGTPVPSTATASPVCLELLADDRSARARFTFATPDRLFFQIEGADLAFLSIPGQLQVAFQIGPDRLLVNVPVSCARYQFCRIAGAMRTSTHHAVRTNNKVGPGSGFEGSWTQIRFAAGSVGTLDDYDTAPPEPSPALGSFEQALSASTRAWQSWSDLRTPLAEEWEQAGELASYVNYASAILPRASGMVRRPTLLMSKNWMTRCWSWDHCFNALALAHKQPDLAWDQWMTVFDHQTPEGALPDCIGANVAEWGFVKPPIHGWTLGRMNELNPAILTTERCEQAYDALKRWTLWWFETRDLDGDGIPEYQHGNDSGWDNSTVFDDGLPVASPDLAAYLIVQCETLARLGRRLGYRGAAATHESDAAALADRLVSRLWDGTQFRARRNGAGFVRAGDSLQPFLALLAGHRLPAEIRRQLSAGVERFITCAGAATECPESPDYNPDGYWRGPVWGSSTVLLVDGLLRCGYPDPAHRIALAYCSNAAAQMCFAENYEALAGRPLRDKAYTWGSSAFLYLASTCLGKPPQPARKRARARTGRPALVPAAC